VLDESLLLLLLRCVSNVSCNGGKREGFTRSRPACNVGRKPPSVDHLFVVQILLVGARSLHSTGTTPNTNHTTRLLEHALQSRVGRIRSTSSPMHSWTSDLYSFCSCAIQNNSGEARTPKTKDIIRLLACDRLI